MYMSTVKHICTNKHIPLLLLYMRIQQIKTMPIIINRIPTTAPIAAMYSTLITSSSSKIHYIVTAINCALSF